MYALAMKQSVRLAFELPAGKLCCPPPRSASHARTARSEQCTIRASTLHQAAYWTSSLDAGMLLAREQGRRQQEERGG